MTVRYALSAERMRRAEERAVAESGASLAELMERAGAAVARHAESMAGRGRVVVLAGTGNNGGDGWVAADALRAEGRDVAVIAPGGLPLRSPAADAASRALSRGVAWREGLDGAEGILADASLVVDALFGFGFRGGAREPFASAIRAAGASGRPVLAVDVPSGVDSDTGAADGPAIAAVRTLTFSTLKPGLLL
ncbi:MAG: NAD(P)H-hydrate epimerase, partial [Coriobacteriia bacterium]|nr:NAD(P)H-hydrate epimerase [Coriobacteriia bacterium]